MTTAQPQLSPSPLREGIGGRGRRGCGHGLLPPAPSRKGRRLLRLLRTSCTALIIPVSLGIAWEVALRSGLAPGRLMPPPSRLFHTAAALAASGELQTHVAATMTRVAIGFGIGAAAGTLFGMLTGASTTARQLLDPSIQALRAIPSIAWVPIFILWLGIFETSKLALIALGVLFPVYLGMLSAIQSVDRKLMEVGRVFGFSGLGIMLRITWPAVLPIWIASLRSGLGLGFMFVVAAELMGASEGLGYLLLDGQQMGRAEFDPGGDDRVCPVGQAVGRRASGAERAAAALAGHGAEPAMTTLAIEGLGKTYADGTEALRGMQMVAHSGEIVALLGGSGCGKTTLLRLTAGLDQPSAGAIAIDGQPIVGTHPAISAVFQEPRLLPWLNVAANIAFGGRRVAEPDANVGAATCCGGSGSAAMVRARPRTCRADSNSAWRSPGH